MSPAACLILSGIFFAIAHSSLKLVARLPTVELVFCRAVVSAVLSYTWLRANRVHPWGRNKPMLILRGIFGTASILLLFFTVQTMPLASAITLNYLAPIFAVLLSWLLLRERPRPSQWACLLIAFTGVLLVRGFDPRVSTLELVAGIGGALCAATAYSLVRQLKGEDHPLVVVFYFPLVTLAVISPFALHQWVPPNANEWPVLVLVGAFTQVGQYYMTRAYQGAPAANISTLNYLGVLYAMLIGYFVFAETIAPVAVIGFFLIVGGAIGNARVSSLRR